MTKINKIICTDCGIEYEENKYYLSRIEGQERMPICKDCFERELINSGSMETTFKKYNVPYLTELWNEIGEGHSDNYTFPRYMKALYLPQYINLKWKDTDWYGKKYHVKTNFYDGIVKSLKDDAKKLNTQLSKAMDSRDMGLYISTVKSLRDTLDLIGKYDWKLMYSEYGITQNKKQVSVWEQNHDNQIKNHKVWDVNEASNIATNMTKDSINIIGDAFKSVSVEEKIPMYIDCIWKEGKDNNKVLAYVGNELIDFNSIKPTKPMGMEPMNISDYASIIHDMAIQKGCEVYVNTQGFGMSLYDYLVEFGDLKVNKLVQMVLGKK